METICIVKENDLYKKYKISFNEKDVRILREVILGHTCIVTPKTTEAEHASSLESPYRRNIKRGKCVGVREYECGSDETLYKYTFDEYTPSDLVLAIDKLLNGKPEAFQSLVDFDYSTNVKDKLKAQINDLSIEVDDETIEDNIGEKIKKLDALKDLLEVLQRNREKEDSTKYKERLFKLLDVTLISEIKVEDVERVTSFFDSGKLINAVVRTRNS